MIRSDRRAWIADAVARWWLHGRTLALAAVLSLFVLGAFVDAGARKGVGEIAWADVAGEGATFALVLAWFLLMLASRPAGRVTHWLAAGLVAFLVGLQVDLLDEFWRLPEWVRWDDALEGGATAVGMLLLTVGLVQFAQEQRIVSRQLARREGPWREHHAVDALTLLYDARYLRSVLDAELERAAPLAVLVLDIDGFAALNRELGAATGDRLLAVVAGLLLLQVEDRDLVCRYAGDRFVCVLLDADRDRPERVARAIGRAIAHLGPPGNEDGTPEPLTASFGIARGRPGDRAASLLRRANETLDRSRRRESAS